MARWDDWLVAGLALYGAGLSTWMWMARRPRRDRQREALDLLTRLLAPIERNLFAMMRQVEEDPQGKHAYEYWEKLWPQVEILLDRYDAEAHGRLYRRKLRQLLAELTGHLREMERARRALGGLELFLRSGERAHGAILAFRQASDRL